MTVHVEGSVNFDRIKLEKLRDGVARLLCIPPQFVVVDGIEPGNSFLITFSIAEEYIDFVFEMQQCDSDYITAEGVDFVKVKEKVFDLKCKICLHSMSLRHALRIICGYLYAIFYQYQKADTTMIVKKDNSLVIF